LQNNNLRENEDFFNYEESLKISKLLEESENSESSLNVISANGEQKSIRKCSNILSQLVIPIKILRIYVIEKHKEKAVKIVESLKNQRV